MHTDHLAAAGARHVSRRQFLASLKAALLEDPLDDFWRVGATPEEALETALLG